MGISKKYNGRINGFALPTVLIASIIMLVVLLAAVTSVTAVRTALVSQYYNQLSQTAADAGKTYANNCLNINNGIPQWSNAKPLMPSTDCKGNQLPGFTCPANSIDTRCSVMINGDIRSSFSVGMPDVDINGKSTALHITGTVNLLRSSNNSVWRSYTQSAYAKTTYPGIVTGGIIMNLDASDPLSYTGSGTTWNDLSGNNNNATLYNSVGYSGSNGKYLTFDGVSNYANVTTLNGLTTSSNAVTIELWANIADARSAAVINANPDDTTNRLNIHFPWADGTVYWDYGIGNSGGGRLYTPMGPNWYNVMADWVFVSGASGQLIYRNGSLIAASPTYSMFTISNKSIDIARYSMGGTYWKGSIGKISIYNRALSSSEVLQNYNALKGRYIGSTPNSCLSILNAGESVGSGIYTINSNGTPIQVYCDMTTDGGGWTLVLQNNSTVTTPSPVWSDAIYSDNISGTLSGSLTNFDNLVGLGYWDSIGTQLRAQVGSSPTTISHEAIYSFYLDPSNYYAINLSNQSIVLGGTAPGLYYYHNGRPFTTSDADHDAYGSNCSTMYNNHPWWYGGCWDGNFFAGGSGYQEAPYWTSSTTDYYAYGSIWVR